MDYNSEIEKLRLFLKSNLNGTEQEKYSDDKSNEFLINIGVGIFCPIIGNSSLSKNVNGEFKDNYDDVQIWLNDERQKSIKFQTYLIKQLNAKGFYGNYPTLYKKSDIDRRLFSRITSEENEQSPDKRTVFKLIIGLELSLEESEEMLGTVGYCYNAHKKSDMIIKYCVLHGIYDPYIINNLLLAFDEKCLFFA